VPQANRACGSCIDRRVKSFKEGEIVTIVRCSVVFAGILAMLFAGSAYGQIDVDIYLELTEDPGPRMNGTPVPPDGSIWHELYPNFCTDHTQINYEDGNGDGIISKCDGIRFSMGLAHVEKVCPTYHIYYAQFGTIAVEPDSAEGTFHEINPGFCGVWEPVGGEWWLDENSNGEIDEGDKLILKRPGEPFGYEFEVVLVGVNITIDTLSPAEPGTWGRIKTFFSQIF
jgi:hypothetical protein